MNTEELRADLIKSGYVSDLYYFEELDSTNLHASRNFREYSDDTIIITGFQKNGRGRFERKWDSEKNKNLTFSLIKKFKLDVDKLHVLIFYTSYILLKTVCETAGDKFSKSILLKWPNDLLFNRKKIAGILLEVKEINKHNKVFIIGIGLNVNQMHCNSDDASVSNAASLKSETGMDFKPEYILVKFINNFYGNLQLLNSERNLIEIWKSHSFGINEKISFRQFDDDTEQIGLIKDIDADGGIIINFENGKVKKFFSGEIKILY